MQTCHDRSLTYINQQRLTQHLPPLTKRKCRDRSARHCPCFSRSGILYKQLQTWMPKDMKYCSSCSVFTKRRKSRGFRCTHNPPHPHHPYRTTNNSHLKSNLWTSHKGHGGYYKKLWKKWFNNSAWDAMEERMRGERKKNERYDLRRGYRPRVGDTRGMRCERFVG
ncbi:ff155b41-e4db-48c1-9513-e78d3684d457 [Sclerotinia trifoliorum]|uniref:Ff155b41-e4db-48c1-9513-e78d3684d457 n=1 Tax=Sclerotinia trifoliorum TaxID=28548 RepID=A0A8H2VKH9_9HELO|nr:ff155b41-e4db-48c1-9513-e78d3684d457 [Sclerotinia trifoliorum]